MLKFLYWGDKMNNKTNLQIEKKKHKDLTYAEVQEIAKRFNEEQRKKNK